MPTSSNLIADAVVAAVRGLNLQVSAGPPAVTLPPDKVQKLKTASLPQGVEPPFVAVVVGEMGAEGMTEAVTSREKSNSYPTQVVIFTAAGGRRLADDPTVREWRVAIENELDDNAFVTFATVPGFNKVDVTGQAPFDGSLLGRDLNRSGQVFRIEVIEGRSA